MKKALATFLTSCLLIACAGVEVDVWDSREFAAGSFETYSWRSEPISNEFYVRDPIYVIDPILRDVVDAELAKKGYRKIARGGDFSIDYIYAPGMRLGAPNAATSFINPNPAVRPNANVSQAERDNAIALAGVKETRNIALQVNDGETGREVWRAVMTKIVADANQPDKRATRSALKTGVSRAFRDLPNAD